MSASLSRFVRCYHAKTDGWQTTTFHAKCDGKGPTVTIIKVNDYIFGGYTDVSWHSSCSYSSSGKAFIFSLYNTNGYDPVKLIQYQYLNKAMYSCSSYGPTFGGNLGQHDIYTPNDAVNKKRAFTYCGSTYSPPPGNSVGFCSFFAGGSQFTPTDIEVFYETTS
ncbi:TLD domain-containing protein 1-like [Orbicella faveolata]|uniref:TLD domain-containing protein 1-like n=1 Tax=Orbicella faveolata TaxID=48498 RepID=UPI0009E55E5B|nr:TLD domain-containing protein 1-like [Orbicella faveolata]